MAEWTVVGVQELIVGSKSIPCWQVASEDGEGHRDLHVFPKETLEWRAAEYGIDPADTKTLLDMVLHERFVVEPDALMLDEDPAKIAGLRGVVWPNGVEQPVTLYTAKTRSDARKAHGMRLEDAKKRHRVVEPEGNSPLDVIRGAALDSERVSAKEEKVLGWRSKAMRYGGTSQEGLNVPSGMPVDMSSVRREYERRRDVTDELYGQPVPKELEKYAGDVAGDVRPPVGRDEADA